MVDLAGLEMGPFADGGTGRLPPFCNLFLAFQLGEPSIVDAAAEYQQSNPDLFVRGTVTDPKAVNQFNTLLFNRSGDKPIRTVDDVTSLRPQK